MEDVPIEKLEFVFASKWRQKVLLKLLEGPKSPSQISNELSLVSEQVSRVLRQLSEKNLVKCLNPTAKKGRIYVITPEGRKIASILRGDKN